MLGEDPLLARPAHLAFRGLSAGSLGAHLSSGERNLRLQRRDLRPCLLQLELIGLRIDEQQRVALLHELVIGNQYLDDSAVDLGGHGRAVGEDACIMGSRAPVDLEDDGRGEHKRQR